jgi:O-antigen/teichoic acid export membrane protein
VIAGLPFGLIQLSLSFNFRVDTVLLSQHVPDGEVGWYNVAYSSLVLMLLSITSSFSAAVLPTLSREHASRPENVKDWYFGAARVLMALGLPIAVGTTLVADKLIAFLYQPSIAPAWIALAILIWDLPFVMYDSFCGNVTQSIQKERSAARVYFSLGIANILLNLLLIPRFGIIGASFATVLTDAFGALQFYFLLRRELGSGLQFNRVIRVVFGSGMMGILLFLLRDSLHVIPLILVGGLFYAVFVWVSGVFTLEERERLVGFVTRRLRLRPA